MHISSYKGIFFYYTIYEEKRKIKNDNVKALIAMLNAYEQYKTGKSKGFRLVDSLSSQGRLRCICI